MIELRRKLFALAHPFWLPPTSLVLSFCISQGQLRLRGGGRQDSFLEPSHLAISPTRGYFVGSTGQLVRHSRPEELTKVYFWPSSPVTKSGQTMDDRVCRLGDEARQDTSNEWKFRYEALHCDMLQAQAQLSSAKSVAMQRDALAEKVRTLQVRINVMQAHARGARTGGDDHEERWEDGGNDDSDTEQTLPRLRGGRGSESSLEYSPSIHLRERCSDSTSESSPSRGIETLAFQIEDEAFDGSPPADAHARLRPRTLPIVAKAYSSPRQIDNEDRLISLYVKYMTVQMTHSEAIANESELSSWYAECVRSFQRDDD